jgi:hypothetical protein
VKHRVTEGTGSISTRIAAGRVCAYLADPRHAAEWFALVDVGGLPDGSLRPGQRWRFREGARGPWRTVELLRLDCPRGFAWQTRLPAPRTNIRWEIEVTAEASGSSTLRLTTRWLPGLLSWALVLMLALVQRDTLSQRSQRTVERARDALEAAYPQASGPARKPSGGTRPPQARRGRRR